MGLQSSTIHDDAHDSRRILAVECGSARMRFCNQPEQGIDRWGIHDDAHSSRRILAVEFLAVECGSAVIHGDAQPPNAMACSCCMASRIVWFVSVFDQEFCVIQTVINPLRAVGSSKLCVRVLFCARIASGVVFV